MKIKTIKVPDTVVIIKDFYTKDELVKVWRELLDLCSPTKLVDSQTDAAKSNGRSLKTGHGIFLDHYYPNRFDSDILNLNRKLFEPGLLQELIDIDNSFNHLRNCNKDFTLLNYYEESEHYGAHHDKTIFTALTLFWKEPKKFSGGDLLLNGNKIDLKPNDCIIFPGYVIHEVTPIKFNEVVYKEWNGEGRFSIAQFINYN